MTVERSSDAQAHDKTDEQFDRLRRMAETWLSEELKPFDRVRAALMAPRSLLMVGRAQMALELLEHLSRDILPKTIHHPFLHIFLANMGYCHNALGDQRQDASEYRKAIALFMRIRRMQRAREDAGNQDGTVYDSWHAVDLAYAYLRLSQIEPEHAEDHIKHIDAALNEAALFEGDFEELIPCYGEHLHPELQPYLKRALERSKQRTKPDEFELDGADQDSPAV